MAYGREGRLVVNQMQADHIIMTKNGKLTIKVEDSTFVFELVQGQVEALRVDCEAAKSH